MIRGVRDKNQEGSYSTGRVVATRLRHGQPVCDVDVGGNVYRECRFVVMGGGSRAFRYAPPVPSTDDENSTPGASDGAEVLVLFGRGARPHPVVVAAHLNPGSRTRFGEVALAEPGKDYAELNDYRDDVTENSGARVLVSHHGDVVIDTKRSKRPVHIQLDESGVLRVSQNGDASERTLLAGPTVSAYNALVDDVNALRTQVQQLSALVAAAEAAAKAASAAGGPGAPALAAGAVGTVFAGGTVGPYLAAPSTGKLTDAVVASALRISSRSKAEE